ncbi:MAG: prolyl oligopeptidase family serine peptidase [Caldilineae bacterium]|nr:prolyl oligopeptidase family serine peptidase [Chloroflexota bacterium]MCB9175956.1 prolyl oligopeptidase family serine peptidase [Caldilineae bacterium]
MNKAIQMTRRFDPRRLAARGLAALALTLALLPVQAARAEIIDFDPETDAVPSIVDADDMARLEALSSAGFAYFFSAPSPGGRYGYAYVNGERGILDLGSGQLLALPDDVDGLRAVPGESAYSPMATAWEGDAAFRLVSLQARFDADGNLTGIGYHLVRVSLPDMRAESEPLAWMDDFEGQFVEFGPDLSMVLVMRAPGGGPIVAAPRTVTLGEPSFRLPGDPPDGLPGRLEPNPLGPVELQQQTVELALIDMDGSRDRVLESDLGEDEGLAAVSWDLGGGHLALTTRSMPDWDGDRQRDNDPPGAGLPNLGSINVREALGMVAPADNPLVTGSRMLVFDSVDGSLVKRFENRDYPQGLFAGLSFSPSGDHAVLSLALRSDLEGRDQPTYAFPSGLEHHLVHDLAIDKALAPPGADGLSASLSWLDDESLAVAVADEMDNRVLRYDVETEQAEPIWDRAGSFWQAFAGLDADGQLWQVVTATTVDQPLEVFSQHGDGAPRRISEINAEAAAASDLRYETVTWTDAQGTELEGLFVHHASQAYPPAQPGPVVVWQQGGPGGQMVNDFGASVEAPYSMLPNFGIPVFMANAAGRTVKSPQFFSDMAEGTHFGQLDIEQIKLGVEQLVADGVVDADRVGITGCSYGGYFTMQSTRTYPDFYAAANPQCSLTDLMEEFNFGYTPFISYLMGRAPMAEPMEYLKDSPMYGAKDVKTPTLIFHGREDFLPVPLINNIHDQLEANGTPVTFLRVAQEGHGFGFPSSQAYAAQLQLEFFREWLEVDKFVPPERAPSIFLPILGMRWDPRAEG